MGFYQEVVTSFLLSISTSHYHLWINKAYLQKIVLVMFHIEWESASADDRLISVSLQIWQWLMSMHNLCQSHCHQTKLRHPIVIINWLMNATTNCDSPEKPRQHIAMSTWQGKNNFKQKWIIHWSQPDLGGMHELYLDKC